MNVLQINNPISDQVTLKASLLDDSGDIGDLEEEVKLSLVKLEGWSRQRLLDLLDQVL